MSKPLWKELFEIEELLAAEMKALREAEPPPKDMPGVMSSRYLEISTRLLELRRLLGQPNLNEEFNQTIDRPLAVLQDGTWRRQGHGESYEQFTRWTIRNHALVFATGCSATIIADRLAFEKIDSDVLEALFS